MDIPVSASGARHRDFASARFITGQGLPESELGPEQVWAVARGSDEAAAIERLTYIAPEHFYPTGALPVGATDQYLLGLILYHVIRHDPPRTIDNPEEVRQGKHPRFAQLPLLSEVDSECPEALALVVARMTERDPQDRYRHLEDALDEIRACLPLHLALVEESMLRVLGKETEDHQFLQSFYAKLVAHPEIRDVLESRIGKLEDPRKQANWKRHHQKLKDATRALVAVARHSPVHGNANPLQRVAEAHTCIYRVKADWYCFFLEAFVATVREREEEWGSDHGAARTDERLAVVEQAWRQTLQVGIRYMQQHATSD